MYYYPQPPFLICLIGLFVGITCGLAFQTMLKQKLAEWSKDGGSQNLARLDNRALQIAYLGICLGVWIFLAGGLKIFSVNSIIAIGLSLPLTIFATSLMWTQLIQLLGQLQEGGSKALDLDIFS